MPVKFKDKNGPVVLISRPISYTFPLSYAYLAGYLRKMNEDVLILFKPSRAGHLGKFVKQIMDLNPVLVGFGNLYPELKEIGIIIEMMNKSGREFPVVIGGQMVTPTPEFAVEITGADFGVIGEGEIILHQLVVALREGSDPSAVKGLILRQGDTAISTGSGQFIKDLSNLPSIPYDLFPEEKWLPIGRWYAEFGPQPHWRFKDRVINIHGGRGCPFKCNFCYHHSKTRYREIPKMIAEATEVLERFNGNFLYFSDDLVLGSPKRARQLVDELKSMGKTVEFSISTRFDILSRIDDNLLYEMKEAGCRIMGLGIESGSDRILKIIGKNCTAETILRELERLKNVGILPTVSIMVGQHTETREDVEKSISLMKESVRSNPNIQYAFTIATPFPGSKLYDLAFQKGIFQNHKDFYDRYFSAPGGDFKLVANLSEMSDGEVFSLYNRICQVYKNEKAMALGPRVINLEKLQRIFGRLNHIFRRIIIPKFPNLELLSTALKTYDSVYESMLQKMEMKRLRLSGISGIHYPKCNRELKPGKF